jgi:hypothetical protein
MNKATLESFSDGSSHWQSTPWVPGIQVPEYATGVRVRDLPIRIEDLLSTNALPMHSAQRNVEVN